MEISLGFRVILTFFLRWRFFCATFVIYFIPKAFRWPPGESHFLVLFDAFLSFDKSSLSRSTIPHKGHVGWELASFVKKWEGSYLFGHWALVSRLVPINIKSLQFTFRSYPPGYIFSIRVLRRPIDFIYRFSGGPFNSIFLFSPNWFIWVRLN